MKKSWLFFILFLFSSFSLLGEEEAEEILSQMSLDEKIGQLFVAPASPLRSQDHLKDWSHLLSEYHIGSLILKQGDKESTQRLIETLQKKSKYPLLITADAEWGLGMRISDAVSYPRNGELGKKGDLGLIRKIGKEIGNQCQEIGIHLNFSPVADVNHNPHNPVIGDRSFGPNPEWVAQCVVEMALGLEEGGVKACVKHFPGHGDTGVDSHVELPIVSQRRERLDSCELIPFRAAIEKGVSVVMSAHILVPILDPQYPATLSSLIMNDLLRKEMGFKGVIVTDALNMKALTQYYSAEELAICAHKAGCDLLLYGDHRSEEVDRLLREEIPRAFFRLKKAYESGEIQIEYLNEKVLRILTLKSHLFKKPLE